ncbi:MAG: RES family NAD+ phosphorylase [Gemmatimonadaceae bacterium]
MASPSETGATRPLETPLLAYRIADGRHPLLDCTGAALHGGRWNSPGRRVIYAALSYAGAMLERLAQSGIGRVPGNLRCIEITLPAHAVVEEVTVDSLPGWDAADRIASRARGDEWHAGRRSLALLVPSVVGQPFERNVLINQDHPDFELVRASKPRRMRWDERIFGRL